MCWANNFAASMHTDSLFEAPSPAAPLAERLRPKHIDEVVGQSHLLGEGRPLRLAFQSGKLHSMILWGPPGVGKTTLARLMASAFDAEFVPLSAVLSGVKDIREAIAQAQQVLQQRGHTLFYLSMKCIVSINRSRMRSCLLSNRVWLLLSVRLLKILLLK